MHLDVVRMGLFDGPLRESVRRERHVVGAHELRSQQPIQEAALDPVMAMVPCKNTGNRYHKYLGRRKRKASGYPSVGVWGGNTRAVSAHTNSLSDRPLCCVVVCVCGVSWEGLAARTDD